MKLKKEKKRITIEDCKQFAINYGGECLSDSYDYYKKMSWKCINDHIRVSSYVNIKFGKHYCLECLGINKKTIEDCNKIAQKRGGVCLSKTYSTEKLIWQCKYDHTWEADFDSIKNAKSWCPTCNTGEQITLERAQNLAITKGGLCLSTIYDKNEKLHWKCANNHEWFSKFINIYNNHWCQICSGRKKSIDECKKIAIDRGGECLSNIYENKEKKLKWRCKEGHEWEATFGSIKNQKSWCSKCKIGKGEQITRCIFEFVFKEKFITIRPKWLIGSKNIVLELDGYCETLNLAFEFQGKQHYEPIFGKEGFDQLIVNDCLKKQICEKNNIKLIIIDGRIKYNKIIKYIKNILCEICMNFNYDKYINNIDLFTEDMFDLIYESKKYRQYK